MIIKTRCFGEIDLSEDKIITFKQGIFGFENFKQYTLLYDNEDGKTPVISWLQSIEEPTLALPVITPDIIKPDYNPSINTDVLTSLGKLDSQNTVLLLTLTVPRDLTQMTTNLKAPIIINTNTKTGCQTVAENDDYVIKYKVYDIIKNKEKKGEM